nr:hypothetical protein [uncultured Celeribacter sp.]
MVAPQRRDGMPIDLVATLMVRDFGEDAAEFSERDLDVGLSIGAKGGNGPWWTGALG